MYTPWPPARASSIYLRPRSLMRPSSLARGMRSMMV